MCPNQACWLLGEADHTDPGGPPEHRTPFSDGRQDALHQSLAVAARFRHQLLHRQVLCTNTNNLPTLLFCLFS